MPGDVNCVFTKILIPFVERAAGPAGVEAICRAAGCSREHLMADHNWISLDLASDLMRRGYELTAQPGEAEDAWVQRIGEFGMDWKSRDERSYLGTYTMGIGAPRGIYEKFELIYGQMLRFALPAVEEIGRGRVRLRFTPRPGRRMPRWACRWILANLVRYPTHWGLPRARVVEHQCAVTGADSCVVEVRWKNLSLGPRFWIPTLGGLAAGVGVAVALVEMAGLAPWWAAAIGAMPAVKGINVGVALREWARRRHTQRLMDLQSEEIIYSNNELEKKFGELETRIEQLSLLIDLSAAVATTLDPEKIYDQALDRLVHRMGYEAAQLFLVDPERRVLRGHRMGGVGSERAADFAGVEVPLDPDASAAARVATTGLPVLVRDVQTSSETVGMSAAVGTLDVRSLVGVALHVKGRVAGVLIALGSQPGRFTEADVEVLSAVANHVALALDRAESFQTIEELSRGLEEKVRLRTEQLRATNEELGAAYSNLKSAQVQLIQREKMASVGQLVAGVAHELNNPIGFVSSNVSTLEDFVGRLRKIVDTYRAADLPQADRARVGAEWDALKIDYALRYLDPMIQGIREGTERARKIVRDLRVFARTDDDVWQTVDLHEELESSLTLLNHLLKDRVSVHREYHDLPAVECIRSQIDQVFLNVLANAAQAIDGPGAVTIETGLADGRAVVAITDTGPGIPAEALGRIFDPFFTTKPVGDGTGLGLSISYEIVKKHGGQITATSAPGQGTTLTLRIPVARAG
jgi:two-component system NtrC family sensor kinase